MNLKETHKIQRSLELSIIDRFFYPLKEKTDSAIRDSSVFLPPSLLDFSIEVRFLRRIYFAATPT
jgi:hypothetical protein